MSQIIPTSESIPNQITRKNMEKSSEINLIGVVHVSKEFRFSEKSQVEFRGMVTKNDL